MFKYLILAILLITSPAFADTKVVGHMEPMQSELLDNPISLDQCAGLTINEWRGSDPTSKNIKKLNTICKRAISEFEPFLASRGLKKLNNNSFHYNMSLIPDSKNYRGMNDMKYRFVQRFVQKELWAYTSKDKQYIFMVSSINIPEMPMIFSHELFHALSMNYGVFNAHAETDEVRVKIDEELAREFTDYLGLGR